MITVLPDGADCVDHVFGIQVEAWRDRGVTKIDAADLFSGLKQLVAGFFMYSAVNAGADDGVGVGGVYYCVYLHVGDVVSYYFEGHGVSSPFVGGVRGLGCFDTIISIVFGKTNGLFEMVKVLFRMFPGPFITKSNFRFFITVNLSPRIHLINN